jgi:tryptophan-rich sensory protein
MIIEFHKIDHAAAYLQLPYFIWLVFAAALNYFVYLLN